MKLAEIVSFRKDLLFDGAVQLGWFERNKPLSNKAAAHFIFHGPNYHGARADGDPDLQLVDTASFTKEITERISGEGTDEPFMLAIAGYGTGKSHLALTLATLFSQPESDIAKKIIVNLTRADKDIGCKLANIVSSLNGQPYLVVALNGMEDFDLGSEISRQILAALKDRGIDAKMLENLRPRFNLAKRFAISFHESLREDFQLHFGADYRIEDISQSLEVQDEQVFEKVNDIYERKMGSAFPAAGKESLQDFIRVTKEKVCGPGKPFAGLLLLFDEFGRYLEFAVQKPHIAGPAALQQLFEAVQENGDRVFLLAFIQTELKAYISRVAPERRQEINRYITRFDVVRRVRLSSNLETVIASLLDRKNEAVIAEHIESFELPIDQIHSYLQDWLPEIKYHLLWHKFETFKKVIVQSCWPLHPLSTWVLYRLTNIGKSLQQRSALSLLADVFYFVECREFKLGQTIRPIELLTSGLIEEFSVSEGYGGQGDIISSYQNVLQKYQHQFTQTEISILKAIVIQQKIGIKVKDRDDFITAISMFSGIGIKNVEESIDLLEREYGVLEWNGQLCQYEIIGNALPRKTFLSLLALKKEAIDSDKRAQLFANCKRWLDEYELDTDFGVNNEIATKEWGYDIYFANINSLEVRIRMALEEWLRANTVDKNKGQLIYCYVGPESNLKVVQSKTIEIIKSQMKQLGVDWQTGAPVAVLFLYDSSGKLGDKISEYWVLEEGLTDQEKSRFRNFVIDGKSQALEEIKNIFQQLKKERNIIFATEANIEHGRLKQMLEQLFDVVYPAKIPFPFDGFHTSRGNAAKDSYLFTIELFLGNLDREWLQARNQQQKNRGYSVLERSWGVFGKDGSVNPLPANGRIREVLKVLDNKLHEGKTGVNLGEMVKLWTLPPYGLNLAAIGLLVALYFGCRKDELELVRNNEVVSVQTWLAHAWNNNFLNLQVLNETEIIKVSHEKISKWELLLKEWEVEPTYNGKIKYLREADQLQKQIAVPEKLVYKFKVLEQSAAEAAEKYDKHEKCLDSALNKLQLGQNGDLDNLASGAALLAKEYRQMKSDERNWTKQQFEEIENYLGQARLKVKELFPAWLTTQQETNLEQLSKFKRYMFVNIGEKLEEIGLEEEKVVLEKHVKEVERNVVLLEDIKKLLDKVRKLTEKKLKMATIPELANWLEQAKVLEVNIQEFRKNNKIAKPEINEAEVKLKQFSKSCQELTQEYKVKAANIYNHRCISSLTDITRWKTEVIELQKVFTGLEKDTHDFIQVIEQLEIIEKHFGQLSNDNLTEVELMNKLETCQHELEKFYSDDQPPLDSELIYCDIIKNIKQRRSKLAAEWFERALFKAEAIENSDASQVLEIKRQLENMPSVLGEEQRRQIKEKIKACEMRLDELEIDGLLAKFEAFPERTKRAFLKKLIEYMESMFPNAELRIRD